MWRVIDSGYATLREIEEHWSISDVLDAMDYLDFREDVKQFYHNKDEAEMKKNRGKNR